LQQEEKMRALIVTIVALLLATLCAAQCVQYRAFEVASCGAGTYWYFNDGVCYSTTWYVYDNGNTYSGSSAKYNAANANFQMFSDGGCSTLVFTETGLTCGSCGSPNGWSLTLNGDNIPSSEAVAPPMAYHTALGHEMPRANKTASGSVKMVRRAP